MRHAAAAPNGHSVYIGDQNGALSRVSIEAVVPAAETSSRETTYVLIRVCEPADLPDEVEAVLQHHYDLSQSEAHLARHLTLSGSMNVTAAQLGITRNTAKTHLRRIYEKTGVHTQLQLAGLVHRLAGLF
ncbi:helix-turn-helix transcriptional regulator [Roseibium salinum]|uniref:helix-turn-helix transcriptional regulator n=1 Tax=Roseibium salinum TaxID=1604349 RepID=UPI00361E6D90